MSEVNRNNLVITVLDCTIDTLLQYFKDFKFCENLDHGILDSIVNVVAETLILRLQTPMIRSETLNKFSTIIRTRDGQTLTSTNRD